MKFKNKTIDTIFVYLWTIWCGLSLSILLIIMFPVFFIGVNTRIKKVLYYMHFIPSVTSKIALFLFGIKVEIINQNLIGKDKQYIFIANHRSYLDALLAAVANNNYKKFIGKAEVLKIPVIGYVLKTLNVPVQRDNKDSRKWSINKMIEHLKDGVGMVVFPEGTCNTTTDLLKDFKVGAFMLSLQTNIPIAIYTIIGAGELMPRNGLLVRPGKIKIIWKEILHPENYAKLGMDQMIVDSKKIMIDELIKYYPNGY